MKRVLVIGGGASGLMAAIKAAEGGAKVTLLEKENKLGKKILASGGGRCNLTNKGDMEGEYRGLDPAFARKCLRLYSVDMTLEVFRNLGLHMTEHDGWVYPYSEQSASVLKILLNACERAGVKIKTGEKVVSLKPNDDGTFVANTETWHYEADAVILCGGTPASEVPSADDSLTRIAGALGHHTIPYLPALTFLKSRDKAAARWGGVRCRGSVTLMIDGEAVIEKCGQLQLIDGGISGIPVFQISRYAAKALAEKHKVAVSIDFLPEASKNDMKEIYDNGLKLSSDKGVFLAGLFPEKLAQVLKSYCDSADCFTEAVKTLRLTITETGNLKNSQVASGGVMTDEIDAATCESKRIKNLYICGEMLDIDGDCGGWNLQFAWSTGALAGQAAAGEEIC